VHNKNERRGFKTNAVSVFFLWIADVGFGRLRPSSDLGKLYDAITARVGRLRKLYIAGIDPTIGRAELVPLVVIELDNLVLSSLRALLISSLRNARTIKGNRVQSAVHHRDEEEIAAFTLSVVNSQAFLRLRSPARLARKLEPTVRDPRDTAKIFQAANLTNISSLQNALALNTTLFDHLCTMRNFYAHRNADTWRKAHNKGNAMGIFAATHVDEIVTAFLPGRSIRVFEDWLDDTELFFEEACK
jgi:hypothetical protein